MNGYRFDVPGDPVSMNRMWRIGWHGKLHRTHEAVRWKDEVQRAARAAGVEFRGDRKWRIVVLYRHRNPNLHLDCGNVEKLVSDALQGVAWANDRAVTSLRVDEVYDPDDPGLTVEIGPTDLPYPTPVANPRRKGLLWREDGRRAKGPP